MDDLLALLRAAGEPTRLRILSILSTGEMTVSEMTQALLQSQPRISRHLKLLADAGLVVRFPEGSWVFYRLNETNENYALVDQLIALLPPDDQTFLRDRERLDRVRAERSARAQEYFAANAAGWDDLRARHIREDLVEAEMTSLLSETKCDLLVDLGTGTGRMLEIFSPYASRAVGFDINANMLTVARARLDHPDLLHCQVRQGDCADVPLEDGAAGVVIVHQVLHFLDDPASAVGEAARLLAPSGRVLIADFLPHEVEALRDEHAHRRLGFSDDEVIEWLNEADIVNIEARHLQPRRDGELVVGIWTGVKAEA
mgnify:FL=1